MPDFILRAEKLSKRYRFHPTMEKGWHGHQHVLVDDIMQAVSQLRGKRYSKKVSSFWALQDVSFDAKQGDVIGIIGSNGAGKTTLLKLLSRVTEPTSGRAILYGRVGSLLEVGTGFHSELTGRENIFISGAIIGMSRAEIKKKFDEIVDFSGVEEFLDTPVKRFSSGMEVRLAFSIAVHLLPQVLLVDEVLSVGDATFQQKSLRKIKEVSINGGTILFVSHNMTTMASLCNQALVLDHGKIVFPLGPISSAIDHYLTSVVQGRRYQLDEHRRDSMSGPIKISGFNIRDAHGMLVDTMTSGMPVNFLIHYDANQPGPLEDINFSILIKTLSGDLITNLNSQTNVGLLKLPSNTGMINCKIEKVPIAPGNISISLLIEQKGQIVDMINNAYMGSVDGGGHFEKRRHGESSGWVLIDQDWSIM